MKASWPKLVWHKQKWHSFLCSITHKIIQTNQFLVSSLYWTGMENKVYSTQTCVFLVKKYANTSSYIICCHKYNQRFPGVNVPRKVTTQRLVKSFRFHSMGSVLHKNRKMGVQTVEKSDEIGASLEIQQIFDKICCTIWCVIGICSHSNKT